MPWSGGKSGRARCHHRAIQVQLLEYIYVQKMMKTIAGPAMMAAVCQRWDATGKRSMKISITPLAKFRNSHGQTSLAH